MLSVVVVALERLCIALILRFQNAQPIMLGVRIFRVLVDCDGKSLVELHCRTTLRVLYWFDDSFFR